MRRVLVLACVAVLAACGGEQHSDLKNELNELTKDLRGRVDPLPQVRPYEPVPYQAEGEVDPFRPDRIEVAAAPGTAAKAGGKQPDLDRPKEPLEAFPLESIQMVGSLTQGGESFGLVKAGPNLYRVRKGNYMGQNFGVITGIDEVQISLKELIQEGSGEWIERSSSLQLQEVKK
ncbi:MAG: pilus assembly protein PilP [Betaproteobacteria bacterium]|nr:pilus assembly protein PilP [Betaproteobacteria bacterium]MDH5220390.1 pilus assembly protein PilP [Betaproteobacteria bacterium]MDH5349928.1 pilus assembly protein PilP [Betaproteobacteria bacterium]